MSILGRINKWIKAESKRSGQSYIKIFPKVVSDYIKYGVNPKSIIILNSTEKLTIRRKLFSPEKCFASF